MPTTEAKLCTDVATLDKNGRLTIPARVRRVAFLQPDDTFEVEVVEDGILLRPVATEGYLVKFWGPNIIAELEEDLADVEAGRTTFYASTEEFLAALDADSDSRDADV